MKLLMNEAMIMIRQVYNIVNIKYHQVFHDVLIDKQYNVISTEPHWVTAVEFFENINIINMKYV